LYLKQGKRTPEEGVRQQAYVIKVYFLAILNNFVEKK
jgi:hypothetical protein